MTFSPSPKLWYATGIMEPAASIQWTPGTPRPEKGSSREDIAAIWDVHRRAAKKDQNHIIGFGCRQGEQIWDLQLGQKKMEGNGQQRHRRSWPVLQKWMGNGFSLFSTLGNHGFEANQAPHLCAKLNYGRGYSDDKKYKCSQKAAGKTHGRQARRAIKHEDMSTTTDSGGPWTVSLLPW